MSEEKSKSYRLFKVSKELNIGTSTLVGFLASQSHKVEENPNTKLSQEQYDLLLKEFASEKRLKEKADQIKVQVLSDSPVQPTEQEDAAPVKTAQELKVQLLDKAEAEKPKLKVVGKVDLEALKKPRAKAPAAEAKPVEKVAEKPIEKPVAEAPVVAPVPEVVLETPVAPVLDTPVEVPAVEEAGPEMIRAKDRSPKLSGLKVVGKIDLSKQEPQKRPNTTAAGTGGSADEKRKRKRKTQAPLSSSTLYAESTSGSSAGKKTLPPGNNKKKHDKTPTSKEVKDNVRSTLGELGKGTSRSRQKMRREKRDTMAAKRDLIEQQRLGESNILEVTEFLTANELASLMDVSVNEVIAKCLELGLFVSINQRIDREVIELIAQEFGYEVRFVTFDEQYLVEEEEDDPELLQQRPPIVTVMGHVDHGKTSLLDFIRTANVVAGEAGGITQHIGAYEVTLPDGRSITFLDTPGHEAFTAMRARGAQVTDVAIIVVAADDQVMPQTREAINHAQAAGVPMVIAINKIDKPGANADKIREQLAGMNLLVEEWGGKIQCQEISAKQGLNIDKLLDKVLLESEILDLKANPDKPARGVVIEAQLDKGRGAVATVLVQSGTLKIGDIVLANAHYGRVKAMTDERGNRKTSAGPATPVQILGLDGVPAAGDKFQVMETDREARELATKRAQLQREQTIRMTKHITLEEIARRSALGDFQELNIIVKGDVDGSVEALADSLLKLSAGEVAVNIIMRGVGQITESDVLLASASNAVIVGFQVRPSSQARKIAESEEVEIRLYSVIYDAINEIKDALEGLLKPTLEETIMGTAEVREVFRISKVGTVAGCMVTDGKIERNNPVRLIRDGIVAYAGQVDALKRFKDDVKEVAQGFECGISIQNFNDIKVGDVIESYTTVEVKRKLAELA
ncbi:MAG: translation initiation factor IF-2 [Bacteroidia bacterium]|nr:translation initiation factor IF-2 [Bacteroidia bacterium]